MMEGGMPTKEVSSGHQAHPYLSPLADGELQKVYDGILTATKRVADHLRFSLSDYVETSNEFGEQQLDTDVDTDNIIFEALKETGVVYGGMSEETPVMKVLNPEGQYIVTFDPLDGSSVLEANFAVGSIFAIWKRRTDPIDDKDHMIGFTGKDVIGAALSCFGPQTGLIVYNQAQDRVD